jgi:FkbM family methyltransferase
MNFVLLKTKIPIFPIWPETTELERIKVLVKDSPLDARMRRRLLKGWYENAERQLVQSFIQPGDHVLELGASQGIMTCFLSRQAAGGRVVSVEADASLRRVFDAHLALNGLRAEWVQALCCPVWGMGVPEQLARQSFIASEDPLSGSAGPGLAGASAPVWQTAEAICRETGLAPTALVVDIEGAESVWAECAPSLPRSVRSMIVEFHPRRIGPRLAGEAIQRIIEEGFKIAGQAETVLAFQRGN